MARLPFPFGTPESQSLPDPPTMTLPPPRLTDLQFYLLSRLMLAARRPEAKFLNETWAPDDPRSIATDMWQAIHRLNARLNGLVQDMHLSIARDPTYARAEQERLMRFLHICRDASAISVRERIPSSSSPNMPPEAPRQFPCEVTLQPKPDVVVVHWNPARTVAVPSEQMHFWHKDVADTAQLIVWWCNFADSAVVHLLRTLIEKAGNDATKAYQQFEASILDATSGIAALDQELNHCEALLRRIFPSIRLDEKQTTASTSSSSSAAASVSLSSSSSPFVRPLFSPKMVPRPQVKHRFRMADDGSTAVKDCDPRMDDCEACGMKNLPTCETVDFAWYPAELLKDVWRICRDCHKRCRFCARAFTKQYLAHFGTTGECCGECFGQRKAQ